MEARRMTAVDRFEAGPVVQAELARELGVSHQTVSDWQGMWRQGGREALLSAGRAGRLRKLTAEQLTRVEAALEAGPAANGFATDLWTLARVADVIETISGIRYHPGHVWRILHDQLGWTRQRPARRAAERDDAAIDAWVKTRWPQIKKAPGAGTR
jgi:transposase